MNEDSFRTLLLSLSDGLSFEEKSNRTTLVVPVLNWALLATKLRKDPRLDFDLLSDHTAVDWPAENQIELLYQLYSTSQNLTLMISIRISRESALAPSVCLLWPIAEWQEREVFDLMGVKYTNHPDLRRLFLEDDWLGFPLRKDYKDDFLLERPW